MIGYPNGKVKPSARAWSQCNGAFVDCFGDLDLINARGITDTEIQILAIEANAQLIIQERLGEGFIRNFRLLTKDNGQCPWGEVRRWLRSGEFVDRKQQGSAQELLFGIGERIFLAL